MRKKKLNFQRNFLLNDNHVFTQELKEIWHFDVERGINNS